MTSNLTEKAKRVIFFARSKARQFDARAVEPEHILLALIEQDQELFDNLSTDLNAIRLVIESAAPRVEGRTEAIDLAFSPSAKNLLTIANQESRRFSRDEIGTEHLLLALVKAGDSLAARILKEQGVSAETIEALIRSIGATPQSAAAANPAVQFLTQLNALIEVLINQGLFTREEFVEALASRYILPDLHATLHSLLALLARKGIINENDRRQITGLGQ
ncbi:MAG TPA: Clp protease N-terminal domain-containing protein [Blastocatellia bacterium]|nr:Clp protease N-terminal domain-containing protein [Blastocatellia bacterium]